MGGWAFVSCVFFCNKCAQQSNEPCGEMCVVVNKNSVCRFARRLFYYFMKLSHVLCLRVGFSRPRYIYESTKRYSGDELITKTHIHANMCLVLRCHMRYIQYNTVQ